MFTKQSVKRLICNNCYKLTEFSYQTKVKHINSAIKDGLRFNLNKNRESVIKLGLKGSDEFKNERQEIFGCNDGKLIYKLFKKKEKNISYDQSVYTAGITKCGEIGDVLNAWKIIKIQRKHGISRDINCYNILFRAFALNEVVYEYEKYINYMIKKDNIKPNIITASILIGGCKSRGDIETAINIWNNIIIKFNLCATEINYVQILSVYAKCGDINGAKIKFKEMMEKGIKPSQSNCGALMYCFAACLDINNVIKIKQFMQIKGIKLNHYHYGSLMIVYLKNRMPLKALEIFNEYVNTLNHNDIPHYKLLHKKHSTFLMLLEQNIDKNIDDINTEYYYNMITKHILDEIKTLYGRKTSILCNLAHNLLTATVLYHNNLKGDQQKTIEIFLDLCEKSIIGYWKKSTFNGVTQWMLDFHSFGYVSAKFVLEYVFKYEMENILDMNDILILCGKGYHRDPYSSSDRHPNQRGIMYFIQHELAKWSPIPIRSQRCQNNHAVLRLFKHDVVAYFKLQT